MNHPFSELRRTACLALLLLLASRLCAGDAPRVETKIDWPAFMARQDLVWERMPSDYYEGPFFGNGLVGAVVFADKDSPGSVRFEIGRTDVYDHQETGPAMHYRARLPIGQLLVTPVGKILRSKWRLDLWNAEVRGELETDLGKISLRCFAPDREPVLVVEMSGSDGEKAAAVSFRPQQGDSPRHTIQPSRDKNFTYIPNPPFVVAESGGMQVVTQPLLAGSDYATAWKETGDGDGRRTIWVSVANRHTTTGSAEDAVAQVKRAITMGVPALEKAHREWWHAFYPKSFVSLPDARIESFYWIQLYKLASATREGTPVVDLMGPWFKLSVWAAYWQNLNTQLAYYTALPTNHPELGESLCSLLERRTEDLIRNVPEAYRSDSAALGNPSGCDSLVAPAPGPEIEKLGNGSYHFIALPWLMQQFYLQYRHTMDENRLRESIYPLLRRTFNTYLHVIKLGPDGRYHIPMAFSDEYGSAEDTNLNIALLRWGLLTLLECNERLKMNDPLAPKWREVLDKLADYPADENGLMIGKDVPFNKPHRHSSHMFAIFPFHVMNVDEHPDKVPLMKKSIDHFLSFEGDDCMFKFTGASSLYAALGLGDDALRSLQRALEPQPKGPTIGANTLYSENGWPTFESPVSAARAVLDMLLQSWGKSIRVFPAMPGAWRDAAFENLRAEGAFLVTAVRHDGNTAFVRIKSLAGEPCRLRVDGWNAPVVCVGTRRAEILPDSTGVYCIPLEKGQETVLFLKGREPKSFVIAPVTSQSGEPNAFGTK